MINAHWNQRIDNVESSLSQKLDELQNDMFQKLNNLEDSISRLTNQQHVHSEEENPEEVYLSDTMVEEHSEQQLQEEMIEDFAEVVEGFFESSNIGVAFWPWKKEEIIALLIEEGSGKEAGKEPQKLTIQPIPMKLNPSATAKATKSPLPVAPSTNQVYILPIPAAQFTLKTPAAKAKAILFALLVQNFEKLMATAQTFATTSRTWAASHIAWHSGRFGC